MTFSCPEGDRPPPGQNEAPPTAPPPRGREHENTAGVLARGLQPPLRGGVGGALRTRGQPQPRQPRQLRPRVPAQPLGLMPHPSASAAQVVDGLTGQAPQLQQLLAELLAGQVPQQAPQPQEVLPGLARRGHGRPPPQQRLPLVGGAGPRRSSQS
ncbi:unnamed protein product [Prorocentrum cordatum]|uniref:Uncharacterized protein n=1 Tax=Prorocentrum cordatum TaxID=2364126 RepID=A0ABN9U1K5_9DINO|nr:unnamed protein product [Polarella glacialis]